MEALQIWGEKISHTCLLFERCFGMILNLFFIKYLKSEKWLKITSTQLFYVVLFAIQ